VLSSTPGTVFAMVEHDLGDGWVTKLQLDHKISITTR
jgi:hypothetical protein